jgi:hypothetical protein
MYACISVCCLGCTCYVCVCAQISIHYSTAGSSHHVRTRVPRPRVRHVPCMRVLLNLFLRVRIFFGLICALDFTKMYFLDMHDCTLRLLTVCNKQSNMHHVTRALFAFRKHIPRGKQGTHTRNRQTSGEWRPSIAHARNNRHRHTCTNFFITQISRDRRMFTWAC